VKVLPAVPMKHNDSAVSPSGRAELKKEIRHPSRRAVPLAGAFAERRPFPARLRRLRCQHGISPRTFCSTTFVVFLPPRPVGPFAGRELALD